MPILGTKHEASRTHRAVDLVEREAISIYEAAKRCRVSYSSVWHAVQRKKKSGMWQTCSSCHQDTKPITEADYADF